MSRSIQFDTLAKIIPDVIMLMTKEGKYLDVISNYKETHIPPQELIGKNIADTPMPPALVNRFLEIINLTISTDRIQYVEYEFPKGGTLEQYEARIIKSDEDEVLVIVRNVSRLKQMEQQLKEANEKLKKIAWLNSHEVRGPVSSILGLLSVLEKKDLNTGNFNVIEKINDCASALDMIVRKTAETADDYDAKFE